MDVAAPWWQGLGLESQSWQGVSGVVAIVSFFVQSALTVWAARRADKKDRVAQALREGSDVVSTGLGGSSVPARLGGAVLIWVGSYLLYALVWLVLCVALNSDPAFILAPAFTVLAVLPGTGALLARSSLLGGALGGALPLAVFVLLPMNAGMLGQFSPFAWFVFAAVIGGAFGALTSGAAVNLGRARGIALPRGSLDTSGFATGTASRLRRRVLEYLLIVTPVAVVVVVTVLVWDRPPESMAHSPGYVPSPAERELLATLPSGYGPPRCSAAPERAGITILAAVVCPAGPDGEKDAAAYFYRFTDAERLDEDFRATTSGAGVPDGESGRCQNGESFRGPWTSAGVERGLLACFINNEGANLLWTDRQTNSLGWRTRADRDIRALYGWWNNVDFAATAGRPPAPPVTPAEQQLLADLPRGFEPASCRPVPERESSLVSAAVVCAQPTAEGATAALFFRFTDRTALDQAVLERAKWQGLPQIDGEKCGTRAQAYGEWKLGGQAMGYLACRRDITGYTMVWSDRPALGLGIANRGDGDAEALAAWWQISTFVKSR